MGDIVVDGQTAHQGTVIDFDGDDYHVDLGVGVHGTLPSMENGKRSYHAAGSQLTVYVVGKDWAWQHLKLSSVRQSSPMLSLQQLVADGQTPYGALVLGRSGDRGCVLDIGCEKNAFLPDDDPL